MRDLRLNKIGDYAIGLPEKGKYTAFPRHDKPTSTGFVVQRHDAERAGTHFDLRIQVPGTETGASWAVPKARLPEPGRNLLAIRQGDHRTDYFNFEGRIPKGYGKGEVSIAHSGPVEILESRPDFVRFGLYGGPRKHRGEYMLRQTGGDRWLLRNVTPTREKAKLPSDTQYRYRDVKMDRFDPHGEGVDHAKLDGAHTLAHFEGGKFPRVYSYRKSKRDPSGLIEHSHKIEHLWDGTKVPKELGDTMLRGEVWGRTHKGKPMDPSAVAGLLNSNIWKSRQDQKEVGKLRFSPFDIVRHKGKDVRHLPYEDRWKLVKQVAKQMNLELPETASTPAAKRKLWEKIRSGDHHQTEEGIVRWTEKGPVKLKVRQDVDVPIHGIFEAREGTKYHGNAAGGILVKHDGVLSRVGTGFSDEQRRHMHQNPELYKGMIARVEMHDVTRHGKLRGPSFAGFHPDKNEPSKLEKVVHQGTPKIAHFVDVDSQLRVKREG